jgi:hypothetical protein
VCLTPSIFEILAKTPSEARKVKQWSAKCKINRANLPIGDHA